MLSVVADETLLGSEHAKEIVWRLLGRDAPVSAWGITSRIVAPTCGSGAGHIPVRS